MQARHPVNDAISFCRNGRAREANQHTTRKGSSTYFYLFAFSEYSKRRPVQPKPFQIYDVGTVALGLKLHGPTFPGGASKLNLRSAIYQLTMHR